MSTIREQVIERLTADGTDRAIVERIVGGLTDAQVTETAASLTAETERRDALRARLAASPVLRQAVCPDRQWEDAAARYAVAAHCTRSVDAVADTHGVTAEVLAQALIDTNGTIAESMAMHREDPRATDFYAFRWRLRDALQHLGLDEDSKRRAAEQAAREARWAREGLERCDRCGGIGGSDSWPGYTCYDCGGLGGVRPS